MPEQRNGRFGMGEGCSRVISRPIADAFATLGIGTGGEGRKKVAFSDDFRLFVTSLWAAPVYVTY